jgi:hypothetical protein
LTQRVTKRSRALAIATPLCILFALLCISLSAPGQDAVTEAHRLTARSRLFSGAGSGIAELRRDTAGNYLVLESGKSIAVYAADGKPLGNIPPGDPKHSAINFAIDFDAGTDGRLYVADRGANAVQILDATGKSLRSIAVASPVSIAAMSNGEFAVTDTKSKRLVQVYSTDGKLLREIGDFSDLAEHERLNRYLNLGRVDADAAGHLYFAFTYFPEPTLRKYDRYGYRVYETSLNTLEFEPAAQAIRHQIVDEDERDKDPSFKSIINAVGVDPVSECVWLAIGNVLVEFDKDGSRMATYQTYTPDGEGLHPIAILVEPGRLLLAADPLGIYEFSRPDVKLAKKSSTK